MNIFEENFKQQFDEMFKSREDLFQHSLQETDFLESKSITEKLQKEGILIDDPFLSGAFEMEQLYHFYDLFGDKKVYHTKNTFCSIDNNEDERFPLSLIWKAEVEVKRPKEKGVAFLNYSILTGFIDFKFESYYEDGTLSRLKIARTKDIQALIESHYFDIEPEIGIFYWVEHDRKDKVWEIGERTAHTDFEKEIKAYYFKKDPSGDRKIFEYKGRNEIITKMPDDFTENDLDIKAKWNFDEEDYED